MGFSPRIPFSEPVGDVYCELLITVMIVVKYQNRFLLN
jgi:hypothetical protein